MILNQINNNQYTVIMKNIQIKINFQYNTIK